MYSPFRFSIACNIIDREVMLTIRIRIKIHVVLGCCNKLKKGPNIVNTRPSIEEIKNLGNRKRFSQKSGID